MDDINELSGLIDQDFLKAAELYGGAMDLGLGGVIHVSGEVVVNSFVPVYVPFADSSIGVFSPEGEFLGTIN